MPSQPLVAWPSELQTLLLLMNFAAGPTRDANLHGWVSDPLQQRKSRAGGRPEACRACAARQTGEETGIRQESLTASARVNNSTLHSSSSLQPAFAQFSLAVPLRL